MRTNGSIARPSLREALANSHVSAVAIAVLLFFSVQAMLFGLWVPTFRVLNYLFEAVAILDTPYFARGLTIIDRTQILITSFYFVHAVFSFVAAWTISQWVYGAGPIRALIVHRAALQRGNRV